MQTFVFPRQSYGFAGMDTHPLSGSLDYTETRCRICYFCQYYSGKVTVHREQVWQNHSNQSSKWAEWHLRHMKQRQNQIAPILDDEPRYRLKWNKWGNSTPTSNHDRSKHSWDEAQRQQCKYAKVSDFTLISENPRFNYDACWFFRNLQPGRQNL